MPTPRNRMPFRKNCRSPRSWTRLRTMIASRRALPSLAASICAPYRYGDSRGQGNDGDHQQQWTSSRSTVPPDGWSGRPPNAEGGEDDQCGCREQPVGSCTGTTSPNRVPRARPTSRSRGKQHEQSFSHAFIVCVVHVSATLQSANAGLFSRESLPWPWYW